VVSLVPSLTESMFDLGFGHAVVGITDYCIHPVESLIKLPRLGGTKNPNVEAILDLRPDLVLANWEENQLQTVETLEAYDIPVWVTFPRSVQESLDVLWTLTGLFKSREAAARLQTLELTLEWAKAAATDREPVRYFCPIWYGHTQENIPWLMTFNRKTYSSDLLQILGGENVFADRERRFPLEADLGIASPEEPGERDTRYPRLGFNDVQIAQPDLIVLPDEPFEFGEQHRKLFQEQIPDVPAVSKNRIYLVDGSLITWHGTRLAHSLQELPSLLDSH